MSHAPKIQTVGLSHSYGPHAARALDGVDLSIPRGACLGLLGPNGAGKSTLIGLLNGVIPLLEGEILIDGAPIDKSSARLKAISALAPQDLAFHPRLSVLENLSFFGGAYGFSGANLMAQIDRAVAICDLSGLAARRAGALSGGEKRRLNLAIALLNNPEILYLDEPTVGIDARSRRTILDAISELNRAGATIIYTSHYMEEVEAICDSIAIITMGRIMLNASMTQLVAASKTPRARLFVSGALSEVQVRRLETMGIEALTPRELSAPARDAAALSELIPALEELDVRIERIAFGAGKLEDVYLDALRRAEAA